MKPIIITVDGPSGVGKGTIAMMIAEKLGYKYLDSGSLYRSLALKLYEKNNTVSTGGTGVAMDKFSFVISELKQPRNPEDLKKGIIYMTKLSKVRTIDHAKLWPEYAAPKSNIISVLTMEDK